MCWCKLVTNDDKMIAHSKDFMQNIEHYISSAKVHQDGRVVKALDLSSNGRMSAWVRTPLLVTVYWGNMVSAPGLQLVTHHTKSTCVVVGNWGHSSSVVPITSV